MTYEKNEELIIAALDLLLAILKGGKKIRVLLQKRKKSQASTSIKESDSDTTLASESPSEAEA